MTKTIKFIVPGEPQGKARPIVKKNGHAFTPTKTKAYEAFIQACYINTCQEVKNTYTGRVEARIIAYYKIPKSDSKKKKLAKAEGILRPLKKPDLDNIAKAILDALNGVAYKDDCNVVALQIEKWFSIEPRVEVEIIYLDEER